jgi:hypothetical protein
LRDGGRLCSITSDAPAEERGIRTANLYLRPEGGQLAHLASLAAGGRIELDRFVTTLDEGPSVAARVAAGQQAAQSTSYALSTAPSEETISGQRTESPLEPNARA